MKLLVIGGCGFIGSNVIAKILSERNYQLLNVDALTYTSNSAKLFTETAHYSFAQINLCGRSALDQTLHNFEPDAILHLAAESHVDRSIRDPQPFIESNILALLTCWKALGSI